MILAYHRLARSSERYAWWRPIVTGLIAIAIYVAFAGVLLVAVIVLTFVAPDVTGAFIADMESAVIDLSDPLTFAFLLGSLALLLPALFLATLIMGPRPVGLLSSAAGRLRWGWLARCIPIALAVYGVVFVLSFLVIDPLTGAGVATATVRPSTVLLIVLALLLTPFQAAAEEYVFRGYLAQTIGAWLRHPAWAILLPVPLFALGHDYDIWGILDVSIFAAVAGWLTWRTGGLEAAIVAHVVNNTSLFVLGAFDLVDMNADSGSPIALLSTVVVLGAYSALVLRQAKRVALPNTRTVYPAARPLAVPVPASPVASSPSSDVRALDS